MSNASTRFPKQVLPTLAALALAFGMALPLGSTALAADVVSESDTGVTTLEPAVIEQRQLDLTKTSVPKWSGSGDWGNPATTDIDASEAEQWTWDHTTKTLTIKADFIARTEDESAIVLPTGSTLVIAGADCVVQATSTDAANNISAISCDGDLTVKGSGNADDTLSITADKLYSLFNVKGTLTWESGRVSDSPSAGYNYSNGYLCKTGEDVVINGGQLLVSSCHKGALVASGDIEIKGGLVQQQMSATTLATDYLGILSTEGDLTVSGGVVNLYSNDDSYVAPTGISVAKQMNVNGGNVSADNCVVGIKCGSYTINAGMVSSIDSKYGLECVTTAPSFAGGITLISGLTSGLYLDDAAKGIITLATDMGILQVSANGVNQDTGYVSADGRHVVTQKNGTADTQIVYILPAGNIAQTATAGSSKNVSIGDFGTFRGLGTVTIYSAQSFVSDSSTIFESLAVNEDGILTYKLKSTAAAGTTERVAVTVGTTDESISTILNLDVTVVDSNSGTTKDATFTDVLPSTGDRAGWLIAAAVVLLVAGVGCLVLALVRRKRH